MRRPGTCSGRPALRFPTSVGPWTAEAELRVGRKVRRGSWTCSDQARRQLRIRSELRPAACGALQGGGPEVITALNGLAQNLEPFSRRRCTAAAA
jgi:hypothetical protein